MEEQQHKNLPAASSNPASSGSSSSSSSSRSIHGSMSSAFLGGVSSSPTHSQSKRRSSSPSLYPPPPLSGSAAAASAGGSSASGSSPSSQLLHQLLPSPGAAAKRRARPNTRITHSLPSPFLSELSAIRRMGTNVSGDLNAQAQEIMVQRRPLLHHHQQQQEIMSQPHHHTTTPIPSGEISGFPGFAPQPLQQQQAQPSFSTLQPLPGGNFSGFSFPASQTQQMQPSTNSTDLPISRMIFSGLEPLPLPAAASQHFSSTTYVPPLPSWSTIFQSSSSCSAHQIMQPPSDDSELPPLPPSLEIRQFDLPPLGELSWNNNGSSIVVDQSSRSGFVQPSSNSEAYELPPLPESLQIPFPPQLLQQVKQEPVSSVAPYRLDPEIVLLDDDGDVDELSALVHSSFASSHSHGGLATASLPNPMHEQQPTNFELDGMHGQGLQLGSGSGSGMNMRGVGVGQTWHQAVPTPAYVQHDMVNNGGGGSSGTVPWKDRYSFMTKYSLAEEEAMQKLSHLLFRWSSTASSSCDQSMGSSVVTGSCQQGMHALANKFDMMSIGASSSRSSAGTKLPWNYSSLSTVKNYTNPVPAVPKLMLGGMDRPGLPPRPPAPALGAGASSSMSRRGGTKEHYFSEAEMEKINKDKRHKELAEADSRRVKRILRNREYAVQVKVQKENYFQDLQRRADALHMECSSLSAQVHSHKETIANLKTENRHMEIKLQGLQEQVKLSQDLNNQLQSEIERRKYQS